MIFTQIVNCENGMKTGVDAGPALALRLSEQQYEQAVEDKTRHWFSLLDQGDFEQAYDLLESDYRTLQALSEWKNSKKPYWVDFGDAVIPEITRVTVYFDPPNVPEPRVYIAADYTAEKTATYLYCGCLMWVHDSGDEFRIVREESGFIGPDQMNQISSSQRPHLKQLFNCIDRGPSKGAGEAMR